MYRVWVVAVVVVVAAFADYTGFRCSSSSRHRLGHPVISLMMMLFQSAGAAVGLSCSHRDPCWKTLLGGLLVETCWFFGCVVSSMGEYGSL